MKISTVHALAACALALLPATYAGPTSAQRTDEYPTKPIRIVVPFAPGGPIDVLGRLVTAKASEALGVSVLIDNRPGANGLIGTELVARSPKDGYTLLYTTGSHAANATMYRKLPYDSVRDFAPITQLARAYGQILVVHPSVPAKNVKELIALAKARPGKLNYASAGVGNATHMAGAFLFSVANVDVIHVPYKGGGPAMNDVLSGQIEMMFVASAQGMPFIKAGRIRALGISGPKRLPLLPDVPTFEESGYRDVVFTGWHGWWAPAGTPRERMNRIQGEVARIMHSSEMKQRLDDLGLVPVASTPEEFAKFVEREIALHARIAKAAKMEPQ
jgi:tripartite-type tricarboxylate transporter receptor subunit TctC